MGRSKLCLPVGARPLGSIALEAAAASLLNGVAVVTQAEDSLDWIPSFMFENPHRRKWIHVPCETARLGMAESLKCGLMRVQGLQAHAVLVILADQPFVNAVMIDHMVSQYNNENKAFIAARYEGIPRPPVLFDSCMFPDLLQLQGDEGARRMIQNVGKEKSMMIDWHDAKCFIDIDTQNDYESLLYEKETD
ncbi:NTP transferase domain-containing protein [Paenibacillus harenae]|uniref:NTP transferase domain-containing protein n=1 Tax=Paenibacillus harenae TaxID=306543 RepID=UPI00146DEFA3|nr:NTP transferase domain-containing protein [Paenibacillus harenae]